MDDRKCGQSSCKSPKMTFNRCSLELTIIFIVTVSVQSDNEAPQNVTKRARHLYLPPEDFFLPEVIDNRVRNGLFQRLPIPRVVLPPPVDLRAPLVKDTYEFVSSKAVDSQLKALADEGEVKIHGMACKNEENQVFFRASVVPVKRAVPVIDNTSEACKLIKEGAEYRLDLGKESFWSCGVQDCSNDEGKFYCLNLRLPAVPGLRLKDDSMILLRCRVQEKITFHTKRINVKTLDTSARMAPRVATGGTKNAFETEVGLYRKTLGSEHVFDAKIQPGGTVILGEEILLRVAVREGDGWRYSRMSDVTVHYVEGERRKKIMNSMWILDSNGCLNRDVYELASREQYRVNPLESYLIFQAFMFDNMQETDEMIVNVKITGCLDGTDCALNCPAGHVRKARSLSRRNNQTINWLDDISFRVVLQEHSRGPFNAVIPFVIAVFLLLLVSTLLCIVKVIAKRRNAKY